MKVTLFPGMVLCFRPFSSSAMACKADSPDSHTFSVTVNRFNGKEKILVIKNSIRRVETSGTWFDLFDYATDQLEDELPRDAWDSFEKFSTVSVSASLQGDSIKWTHTKRYRS